METAQIFIYVSCTVVVLMFGVVAYCELKGWV